MLCQQSKYAHASVDHALESCVDLTNLPNIRLSLIATIKRDSNISWNNRLQETFVVSHTRFMFIFMPGMIWKTLNTTQNETKIIPKRVIVAPFQNNWRLVTCMPHLLITRIWEKNARVSEKNGSSD